MTDKQQQAPVRSPAAGANPGEEQSTHSRNQATRFQQDRTEDDDLPTHVVGQHHTD